MIQEEYTVKYTRKMSDYCKGCPYYSPEKIEFHMAATAELREIVEICGHGNICDRLYARLKEEVNGSV